MVDGQTAGVRTSAAFRHCRRILHGLDVVDGEHGRTFALRVSLAGDKGSSERTHDTCDIRTDRLAVCDLLEASQYGIIVKRTALYDDMISEFGGAGHLDNFKERVLDDRVSQACGNIRDRSPLFLRLFYLGVHKYSTAGSKVNGVLRIESLMCEIFHGIVQ